MKRFLLGLIMVSGLAIVAAPMANAATSPTYICGTAAADHNYAFLVTGTEPVTATTTAATYPLNYIAGVGVLKFGPYSATFGGPGVPGCSIISGEMIYLDNDYQTFQGGPVDCSSISSLDGVPCFDGGNHVLEGGVVVPGPNGSATVAFAMDFPFVLGSTETPLPFSFTVFAAAGGATLIGNSNIPLGGTSAGETNGNQPCTTYDPVTGCGPNSPTPPLGPVLSFTGQRQATSATLNPVPTVAGVAPYIGNSATLCTGFGGNSTDLVAAGQSTAQDQATGTYGSTSGSVTEFANGYAFGSLTFNSNDDVGNTTGVSNYDCDFQQQGFQRYGDGATNNQAALYDENYPFAITPICRDADAGVPVAVCTGAGTPYACCTGQGSGNGTAQCAGSNGTAVGANEVNSSVVWGTSDQNTFTIVTGVSTPALFGGAYLPPGETASCTGLSESAIPGALAVKAAPAAETIAAPYPATKSIAITVVNTSEGACSVGGTLVHTGGAASFCSMSLSAPGVVSEGDGPQSSVWTANCTCTGKNGTNVETDTYSLYGGTATAPTGVGACPNPPQAVTPILLTCKN